MSATAAAPRLSDYTADVVTHQRSLTFVRYLSVLHELGWPTTPTSVAPTFARRWPRDLHRDIVDRARDVYEKATVTPGTVADATWASPLASVKPLADAFVSYAHAASIIGKLPVVTVPFGSSVPAQTTPGVYGWVGENKVKPITRFDFTTAIVAVSKAVGIIVVTDELLRLSVPGTETYLRNALANGVAAFVDRQFVDPSVTAIANVRPASITNGVTPIAPSGTTSAALVVDVGALLAAFFTANADVTSAALVMTPATAAMLAGATHSTTLTMNGGTYQGVPVVVSAGVGTTIVAVDASAILVASGAIEINASRNATLEMSDAPTDPPTAAVAPVSLWQTNMVGLRAEYWINWNRARTAAVKLVSPTAYVPGT